MLRRRYAFFLPTLLLAALAGCTGYRPPELPVATASAIPGGVVSRGERTFNLLGDPIAVGELLPSVRLVDAMSMEEVDLATLRGEVLLLSVVPSVDTRVCEAQTHFLGEQGDRLPAGVRRITVSRDLPFAQKRFAEAARLTDLRYLSDYKEGAFGKAVGLLMAEPMLLARSVLVADRQGIVRYLQVVPDIGHLPDMEQAFREAERLAVAGR